MFRLDESEEKLYYIQKILIPWQALQEIDVLKDNKHNKFSTNKQRGAQRSVTSIIILVTNAINLRP